MTKPNASVAAIQEYRKSGNFKLYSNPESLGAPETQRRFLENRLLHAFELGLKAGEEIAADRIRALALGEKP